MEDGRYVVSIRRTGLGDRLICLCAAWCFARNTGRALLADWRYSPYASSPNANLFSACFRPPQHIGGVSFVGDDRVGGMLHQ
jgi:Nodulation protein Z (NodZ)